MPRPPRIHREGDVYHVFNQIAHGEFVFRDDSLAERFVELLRSAQQRDGLTIFAWVLMETHFHLAVRVGAVPVSRSLKSIQQQCTRHFNVRNKVFGPLWRGRFRSKIVNDQKYLEQLVFYIHLNPVTARLVQDPAKYRWSGHREVIGLGNDQILDLAEFSVLFGHDSPWEARQIYLKRLKNMRSEDWIGEGPGCLPWWKRGRPPTKKPKVEKPFVDELGRSTGLERPLLTASFFLNAASEFLQISSNDLSGRGRAEQIVRARELIVTLAVERYGLLVKDLAIALNKNPQVASRYVSRGINRRQNDPGFRDHMNALDRHLSRKGAAK